MSNVKYTLETIQYIMDKSKEDIIERLIFLGIPKEEKSVLECIANIINEHHYVPNEIFIRKRELSKGLYNLWMLIKFEFGRTFMIFDDYEHGVQSVEITEDMNILKNK